MMRKALVGLLLMIPILASAQTNRLVSSISLTPFEVEIAPSTFVTCQQYLIQWELEHTSFRAVHTMRNEKKKFYQTDTTYLLIPWQDKELIWVGTGIPISIRAYDKKVYLVVWDRDIDFSHIRFRYFRQDHTTLSEISASEYPKQIALQNLWFQRADQIKCLMTLDPDDSVLQHSLTAKLWYQLEEGKEYYEMPHSIDSEFLKKFMEKYAIQRLTWKKETIQPKDTPEK